MNALTTVALTDGTSSIAERASSNARAIVAACLGNALKWFDIVVYGSLVPAIAKRFFPKRSGAGSLLLTLGTIGAAFGVGPMRSCPARTRLNSFGLMLLAGSVLACKPHVAVGILYSCHF